MRSGGAGAALALLAMLGVHGGLAAQVHRITVGGSTSGRAAGLVWERWNGATFSRLDLGLASGARFGGFVAHRKGSWLLDLGDRELSLTLPTDVPGATGYLLGRGGGISRSHGTLSASVFAGSAALGVATPWFRGARHGAALLYLSADFTPRPQFSYSTRTALSRGLTTLHAVQWLVAPGVSAGVSAGLGDGHPWGGGRLEVDHARGSLLAAWSAADHGFRRDPSTLARTARPDGLHVDVTLRAASAVTLSAGQRSYVAAGGTVADDRTTVRHVTFQARPELVGLVVTGYDARYDGAGKSRGLSSRLLLGRGRPFLTLGWLHAMPAAASPTHSFTAGARQSLSRSIEVEESASLSGDALTVALGGRLELDRGRLTVEQRTMFDPSPTGAGFRRVLVLGGRAHAFDSHSVEATTYIAPDGRPEYSLRIVSHFYGSGATRPRGHDGGMPKYLLRGRVVDGDGAPVTGAAVQIGDELVFSGADGRFHLRVRRAQEVSVALDPLAFRTRERYEAVTRALRVRPTVPSDAPFLELRVRREADRNR